MMNENRSEISQNEVSTGPLHFPKQIQENIIRGEKRTESAIVTTDDAPKINTRLRNGNLKVFVSEESLAFRREDSVPVLTMDEDPTESSFECGSDSPNSATFLLNKTKQNSHSSLWKVMSSKSQSTHVTPRIEIDGSHEVEDRERERRKLNQELPPVLKPSLTTASPAPLFKDHITTKVSQRVTTECERHTLTKEPQTVQKDTDFLVPASTLVSLQSPNNIPSTGEPVRETVRSQSEILDIIREQRDGKTKRVSLLTQIKQSIGFRGVEIPKRSSSGGATLADLKAGNIEILDESQMDPLRRQLPPLSTTSIIHFENENQLRTKIITWNMDGHMPANEDEVDFERFLEPNVHHIYAIGTQNCERSAFASFLVQQKIEWEQTLCEMLGSAYVPLASSTLLSTHIIIFVRKDLLPWISDLHTGQVATGFLNEVGDRGATSVSFKIGATSFIFINAHLPGGQNNTDRRNKAYDKIIDLIDYKGKTADSNIFRDINRIFFFGDLNYRVNGNRGVVDSLLTKGTMHIMLQNDQLSIMRAEDRAFNVFAENQIQFQPTFKFAPERNVYDDGEKQSIPSWTDRILWVPNNDNIQQLSYEACFKIRCSSHRPVSGRFLVAVDMKLYKPLSESTRSQPLLATSHACSVQ